MECPARVGFVGLCRVSLKLASWNGVSQHNAINYLVSSRRYSFRTRGVRSSGHYISINLRSFALQAGCQLSRFEGLGLVLRPACIRFLPRKPLRQGHPFRTSMQGISFLPSLCWSMVLLAVFMIMGALMLGNLPLDLQSKAASGGELRVNRVASRAHAPLEPFICSFPPKWYPSTPVLGIVWFSGFEACGQTASFQRSVRACQRPPMM